MKKTTKIRLLSFSAAFLLTLAGLWADARLSLGASRTELEYRYRRALGDLADSVASMRTLLQKAPYIGTAALRATLCSQLIEESVGAKAAMAGLPFSQEKAGGISRFLSQVGDYALSLTRRAAAGEQLRQADLDNLSGLESCAGKLAQALQGIQARLTAEGAGLGATESLLQNVGDVDQLSLLDDGIDQVAQEFAQFPALLYDGPFSDHVSQRESQYLAGKSQVTREEAAQKAADLLGCTAGDLAFAGEGGDKLGVYSFTWKDSRVNVTRLSGEIAYFKDSRRIDTANLTYQDALAAAKKELERLGLGPLKETYYVLNDNLCTINFAALAPVAEGAQEQEALCYPDLVKVTVELKEGGMVEYDASGYLMEHHDRQLVAPALSAEDAQKSLSPLLTAEGHALAVIPTPGLEEVLCWEFHCSSPDGREFLSYVNAESGMEEQLFLLQTDAHGVLVQ